MSDGETLQVAFVHLHRNCPALSEGRVTEPPKFGIINSSEDGTRILLECACCNAQLTLTMHGPDNPPEAFPLSEESPDAPERPPVDVSADAEFGGGTA